MAQRSRTAISGIDLDHEPQLSDYSMGDFRIVYHLASGHAIARLKGCPNGEPR